HIPYTNHNKNTYAIEEAGLVGRVVTLDDPGLGAALWLLPQAPDRQAREHETKQAFLRGLLGARGYANYAGMVRFMHARSVPLIAADAWYLSILGVAPAAQGQGLGRRLLEPTLAEAAAVGVSCWMETFTRRGARFYERSGFTLVAWHDEPTTGWPYAILRREP
ncbi:MAG: GNAT family N-acetyltransferase, partial [Geminicoccaceae bacterium]